jgi:hypothetical protein
VAAEVLELRALLSSATAAVHGAAHHAAIQTANPAGQIGPESAPFHGIVQALVTIDSQPPQLVPGTFSIGKVNVALGSHVSAKFSFSITSGGNKISLKGSFVGTVASFGPAGPKTLVNITPSGGSMTLTVKQAGNPALKAIAIPNGTPILLALTTASNTFFSMGTIDVFKPGSPAGLSGVAIEVAIGL